MKAKELIDAINTLDHGEDMQVQLDGWDDYEITRVDTYKDGTIKSMIVLTPTIPDAPTEMDFSDD